MSLRQAACALLLLASPGSAELSWSDSNWEKGCPFTKPESRPDPAGCSWLTMVQTEGTLAGIHTYFVDILVIPANPKAERVAATFVLEGTDHVKQTYQRENVRIDRDAKVPHATLHWFGDHGIVAVSAVDSREIFADGASIAHRFR